MRSCWLDLGRFLSILNDLNGIEGNQGRQPGGRKRQFGCEGHHEHEKVRKGHHGRQTFEINFDKEFGLT